MNTLHPAARLRSEVDRRRQSRVGWALVKECRCRTGIYGETDMALHENHTMSDFELADIQLISAATEDFSALREVLSDVQGACDALPQAEQERYREAQLSVVNARRSAETHEGLLQVC